MRSRASGRATVEAVLFALCGLQIACAEGAPIEAGEWATRTLRDGTTLAGRSAQEQALVAIVYDPEDCFTCFGTLPAWQRWGHDHPDRLVMAFTRDPGPRELGVLRRYRVDPKHVFEEANWSWQTETPVEMLLVDGSVRYARVVPPESMRSPLLECLQANPTDWSGCGAPSPVPSDDSVVSGGDAPPDTLWPRRFVRCVVVGFEPLAPFLRDRRPLLVVDGLPRERWDPDDIGDCGDVEVDMARVSELSYRNAESARTLWGEEGDQGAIVVRLHPADEKL